MDLALASKFKAETRSKVPVLQTPTDTDHSVSNVVLSEDTNVLPSDQLNRVQPEAIHGGDEITEKNPEAEINGHIESDVIVDGNGPEHSGTFEKPEDGEASSHEHVSGDRSESGTFQTPLPLTKPPQAIDNGVSTPVSRNPTQLLSTATTPLESPGIFAGSFALDVEFESMNDIAKEIFADTVLSWQEVETLRETERVLTASLAESRVSFQNIPLLEECLVVWGGGDSLVS